MLRELRYNSKTQLRAAAISPDREERSIGRLPRFVRFCPIRPPPPFYNSKVHRFAVPAALALAATLSAQTGFFRLKDVRPGMHAVGRTVFAGNRVEDFQVEVLGVLENIGPKESLILARLSGGPLEHTGVMQGMSGSPVYIEGKLLGAVAMAFPFSKDPIAAIRPIEDMVRVTGANAPVASNSPRHAAIALADRDLTRPFSKPASFESGESRMVDIATPISFGGFSQSTLQAFAPQLRALGLEPLQAISGGGKPDPGMGNPADLKPGSMISMQLMSGDLSMSADCTVTYIDGPHIYACGHRFLDVGATSIPFARAEVIALMPNLNTSFKLSAAKEWMGAINEDVNTTVAGELGKRAAMAPLTMTVWRGAEPGGPGGHVVETYQAQMVNDALLSPLLLQMAVYSAIDATERTVGASSLRVTGQVEFQNAPAPIRVDNIFSADNGSALQVSLAAAVPLAYIMQSGFDTLRLKKVDLRIEAFDEKKQLEIDGLSLSKREVRPGDKLQLLIQLMGENGAETTRKLDYEVPIGAEPGPLYFTVADANTTNLTDFRAVLTSTPHTPAQLITTVNNLHPNNKAYVRVWRADPSFQLEGAEMPDPPASVALILAGSQSSIAGITQTRNAKIGEMEIDGGDVVISGVKTIQVEVKE